MVTVHVPTIDVRDEKSDEPFTLLCIKGEREKSRVATSSSPKVLSVDAVLKGTTAILLGILTTISGWLLVTVLDHGDRITKNESNIINQDRADDRQLELLRQIAEKQTIMLQNQAKFDTEIRNIKDKINNK